MHPRPIPRVVEFRWRLPTGTQRQRTILVPGGDEVRICGKKRFPLAGSLEIASPPRYLRKAEARKKRGMFAGMSGGSRIYLRSDFGGYYSPPCMLSADRGPHHDNLTVLKSNKPHYVEPNKGDHFLVSSPVRGRYEISGVFRYDMGRKSWTRVPTGSARRGGGPTIQVPWFEVRTVDLD